MHLKDLKEKSPADLVSMAEELGRRKRIDIAQTGSDVRDSQRTGG